MTDTNKNLTGRVALITGASRGIGREAALKLASAGAHIVALARSKDELEKLDDDIKALGSSATLIPHDLKNIDALEAIGPLIDNRHGRLDIFVANAGMLAELSPIAHSKMKGWRDSFDINVTANVQLIRSLDPLLRAAPQGRVVIVSSGLGLNPHAYWGAYAASKAAVTMLARTYAEEVKNSPMRVNILRPGAVDTAMLTQAFPGGYQGSDLKQPADIAPIILRMCAPDLAEHGMIFAPDHEPMALPFI